MPLRRESPSHCSKSENGIVENEPERGIEGGVYQQPLPTMERRLGDDQRSSVGGTDRDCLEHELRARLDRGLSWREVAMVMSADEDLDAPAMERRSAALRKQWEGMKAKLRTMVKRVRAAR